MNHSSLENLILQTLRLNWDVPLLFISCLLYSCILKLINFPSPIPMKNVPTLSNLPLGAFWRPSNLSWTEVIGQNNLEKDLYVLCLEIIRKSQTSRPFGLYSAVYVWVTKILVDNVRSHCAVHICLSLSHLEKKKWFSWE